MAKEPFTALLKPYNVGQHTHQLSLESFIKTIHVRDAETPDYSQLMTSLHTVLITVQYCTLQLYNLLYISVLYTLYICMASVSAKRPGAPQS